jgi:hypothetical protein
MFILAWNDACSLEGIFDNFTQGWKTGRHIESPDKRLACQAPRLFLVGVQLFAAVAVYLGIGWIGATAPLVRVKLIGVMVGIVRMLNAFSRL